MSEIVGRTIEETLADFFVQSKSRQPGEPVQVAVARWLQSFVGPVSQLVQPSVDIDDVSVMQMSWHEYADYRQKNGIGASQYGQGLFS